MMLGVTSAEAYLLLTQEEMELGLEVEGRNRLLSELVLSTYPHHHKEIFSAILTEYTDWASVSRHPISTRQASLHNAEMKSPRMYCPLFLFGIFPMNDVSLHDVSRGGGFRQINTCRQIPLQFLSKDDL